MKLPGFWKTHVSVFQLIRKIMEDFVNKETINTQCIKSISSCIFFLYEVQSYFIGIVMNILNLFSLLAIQACS